MILQLDPLSQHFEELIKRGRRFVVSKEFFFCRLAMFLVQHSEFEAIDKHVFVVSRYQLRRVQTHHRHEIVHVHLLVEHFRHFERGRHYARSWQQKQ